MSDDMSEDVFKDYDEDKKLPEMHFIALKPVDDLSGDDFFDENDDGIKMEPEMKEEKLSSEEESEDEWDVMTENELRAFLKEYRKKHPKAKPLVSTV